MDEDRDYYLKREAEELEAAEHASCMVKEVHLDLAAHYAARAQDKPWLPFTD